MAIPPITPYVGTVPNRISDTPEEFSVNADNFAAWWEVIGNEMNPTINAINLTSSQVDYDAVTASNAASRATASEGVCATYATGTNGTPLGNYANALTFANHDSYCREGGKLYRLNATTAAGYVTNTATYPTAVSDPNLLESFNFTSEQNNAIIDYSRNGNPAWSSTVAYIKGATVTRFGLVYSASEDSLNKAPESSTAEWFLVERRVGKNLLTVSNIPEPFDNGVDPVPDATPRDYPTGHMIAAGWFVGNPLVGLTYVNGEYSATSGIIFTPFDQPQVMSYPVDAFTASIADSSGFVYDSPAFAFDNYAGYDRVVRINMAVAPDVFSIKVEFGDTATKHEPNLIENNIITLVNALGTGGVNERADSALIPATMSVNQAIIIPAGHIFPVGHLIDARMQMFFDGDWQDMGYGNIESLADGFGAFIRGDGAIVMRTGASRITTTSLISSSTTPGSFPGPYPVRLTVWRKS